MICADCQREVERVYPMSGPLEVLEPLSWEHEPDCAAVLRGLADEEGPWNVEARKFREAEAARGEHPR